MVQVSLGPDFLITLWQDCGKMWKMCRLLKVTGVTKLFIAGWMSGCSKSEFGMVIVAGRLQQLHDCRPSSRHSFSLGCAFVICWGVVDSPGHPIVVESEALSALAAQDLRVRDRAAVRALIVVGLAPLF